MDIGGGPGLGGGLHIGGSTAVGGDTTAGTATGVGAGSDMIGGIVGGIATLINAGLSYDSAQKALAYEKSLNKKIFQREDSAMRRRVRDLRLAGLSPVLATGQGAGSGGTVKTPEFQPFQLPAGDAMMAMIKMQKDISKTAAEQKAIELQQEKTNEETRLIKAKADLQEFDNRVTYQSGVPSGSSMFGKIYNDATGIKMNVEKRIGDMVNEVKKYFNKPTIK